MMSLGMYHKAILGILLLSLTLILSMEAGLVVTTFYRMGSLMRLMSS